VKTLPRIGVLLRPYRGRVVWAFLLTLLACLLNSPIPPLIRGLVDSALSAGPWTIAAYALTLAAVLVVQAAVNLLGSCVTGEIGLAVVRDLRHRLYARLQRLSLAYYDRTPAGGIIARMMDDVAAVQALITTQTLSILTDLGTALVLAVWLFLQSPRLLLVVLGTLPLYLVLFRGFGRRLREGSVRIRGHLDGIFGRLKEKLDGMLVVQVHAREEEEMTGFSRQIHAAHQPRLQVGLLGAGFANLSVTASGIGTALVFAVGALEAAEGRLTPGSVLSVSAVAALLFGPLTRLADLATVFQQAAASIDRLGEILDQEAGVPEPAEPVVLGRVRGRVEFDQVGFGYHPGQPVVWDVRLRTEPGMKVALVGPTGCGKSTLLNLLLRFYDPTWGEIRLDGIPLGRLAPADLRRQIGVVPQEPVIFTASLADNIRYGCPEADADRIERAARAAGVHDFLGRLPQGYDTVVGTGGYRLSQGERQRVAIARALCKDPPLVILDEATSSLDPAGEVLVQAGLNELLRNRTAFIVAHRLATVMDADLIVVMEDGLVVQRGTHAELLAEPDGLYRRLCLRQFGDSVLNPVASIVPFCPPPVRVPVFVPVLEKTSA
jgi:ABC-type multidrug transport system fused ATPase/permease subunit